ncbi:MAG: hypothetical protein JST16_03880 [Bdellovibrionales bacterium]|nr:hypothetical protein [Bdellovibrionales bacterium]
MSSKNIGEIPGKLYAILCDLSAEDRKKVVAATMTLFGESSPDNPNGKTSLKNTNGAIGTPSSSRDFFDQKDPKSKGEELAVAARFLEIEESKELYSKEDLKKILSTARRNFDGANFQADMSNAIHQTKLFNKGGPKGLYQLSYFGQKFIDALPDRDKAKQSKAKRK